jgi:hypothetical protein
MIVPQVWTSMFLNLKDQGFVYKASLFETKRGKNSMVHDNSHMWQLNEEIKIR